MTARIIMDIIGPPLFIGSVFAACSSATPAEKHAEAEGAYGAELQACIAASSNRVESDVCADKVRAKWAVKDGGK